MNAKVRRIVAWTGYPLFYLVCFVLFSYVTAPWDRMKNALVTNFNSSSPLRMEIADLSWAWRFPGISAKGLKLVGAAPPPTPGDPGAKPKPAPEYSIDGMYARVSVLLLLWGTTKVAFTMDGFGGSIDGTTKTSSDGRAIELSFDEVDAAKMPYLPELLGLPVEGTLSGNIDLKLPQDKISAAEGTIDLTIKDFAIGDGKTKIRDTIALPKVRAGEFVLKAEVTEGTVKVTDLSTKGPDLEVVADGKIRLMDRLDGSLAELNLRFKFADAYKNKDDMTRGIFGAPGSNIPGLFDLDPKMKRAKRDDGFYAWHITGPLARLGFQPATGGSTDAATKGRRTPLRGFSKPTAPKAAGGDAGG